MRMHGVWCSPNSTSYKIILALWVPLPSTIMDLKNQISIIWRCQLNCENLFIHRYLHIYFSLHSYLKYAYVIVQIIHTSFIVSYFILLYHKLCTLYVYHSKLLYMKCRERKRKEEKSSYYLLLIIYDVKTIYRWSVNK